MFETIIGLVVVGGALLAFMAYRRSQPGVVPPCPIAADDPEMAAARAAAQSKLNEFRALYSDYPDTSQVKLPVTSSSGVTTANGKYRGGFTQRVHFERMRAAGTLVGSAAEEAARYE